ncbi:MAG: nuclear transport factor 2 family protein [Planctomycetota bacterium]
MQLAWIPAHLAGCAGVEDLRLDVTEERAAIEQVARDYGAGFVSGRADEVLAVVTEDFVALSPGKPALTGEVLRAEIANDLAQLEAEEIRFELLEIEVLGDRAWVRGESTAVILADGQRLGLDGSFLWILRREGTEWRIVVDAATDDGEPEQLSGPSR